MVINIRYIFILFKFVFYPHHHKPWFMVKQKIAPYKKTSALSTLEKNTYKYSKICNIKFFVIFSLKINPP